MKLLTTPILLALVACGGASTRPAASASQYVGGETTAIAAVPDVVVPGTQINVMTSYSGQCERESGLTAGPTSRPCDFVDYDAVLKCDHPACTVEKVNHETLRATLAEPGSYPMRVVFTTKSRTQVFELATVTAAYPDRVEVYCTGNDTLAQLGVSPYAGNVAVEPREVRVKLTSGEACTNDRGIATSFECQVAGEEFDIAVSTPGLETTTRVKCPRQNFN